MNRPNVPILIIKLIATIELSLGLITILGLIFYPLFYLSYKPYNTLLFVLTSSIISAILGYGIFKLQDWARRLLVFFSGYIVLTKLLVFANLLELKGEMIGILPFSFKNLISLAYHISLIIMLESRIFKQVFTRAE